MSKYEQLLVAAANWSADFENARIAAYQAANSLRPQYAGYLGAPTHAISFYVLDRNFDRAVQHDTRSVPDVVLGADGFFYFGLNVNLVHGRSGVNEYFKIGVVKQGEKIRFKRNERIFETAFNTAPTALFDYLFEQSVEQYGVPLAGNAKKAIGFIDGAFVPQLKSEA